MVVALPMHKVAAVVMLERIVRDINTGEITEGSLEFGPGIEAGVPESSKDFLLGGLLRHRDGTLEMIGDSEF